MILVGVRDVLILYYSYLFYWVFSMENPKQNSAFFFPKVNDKLKKKSDFTQVQQKVNFFFFNIQIIQILHFIFIKFYEFPKTLRISQYSPKKVFSENFF